MKVIKVKKIRRGDSSALTSARLRSFMTDLVKKEKVFGRGWVRVFFTVDLNKKRVRGHVSDIHDFSLRLSDDWVKGIDGMIDELTQLQVALRQARHYLLNEEADSEKQLKSIFKEVEK